MNTIGVNPEIVERCPRCGTHVLYRFEGDLGAMSRSTDDDDITVCSLCSQLEAMRDLHGLPQIPIEEWYVSPEELGREYRLLAAGSQKAKFVRAEIGPEQARKLLGGGEEEER